ncbi:MAG: hypothetical protein VB140_03255 [Burkholderia sp.]
MASTGIISGNPFVLPEIMPVDAIASSRSIYATTPGNEDPVAL